MVNQILEGLREGKSMPAMSVNVIGDKYWIINGNHRYEAMKLFFAEYPTASVMVSMMVYHKGEGREEKELYHVIQNTAAERTADFVHVWKKDIMVRKYIDERLDCLSDYSAKTKLKFPMLLSGYIGAIHESTPTQSSMNKSDLVKEAMRLDENDGNVIVRFLIGFMETFGDFGRGNIFSRTSPFTGILRTYMDNCVSGNVKDGKFWQDVRVKVLPDSNIRDWCIYGGNSGQQKFHTVFLEKMNKQRSKNFYVLKTNAQKTNLRNSIIKYQRVHLTALSQA